MFRNNTCLLPFCLLSSFAASSISFNAASSRTSFGMLDVLNLLLRGPASKSATNALKNDSSFRSFCTCACASASNFKYFALSFRHSSRLSFSSLSCLRLFFFLLLDTFVVGLLLFPLTISLFAFSETSRSWPSRLSTVGFVPPFFFFLIVFFVAFCTGVASHLPSTHRQMPAQCFFSRSPHGKQTSAEFTPEPLPMNTYFSVWSLPRPQHKYSCARSSAHVSWAAVYFLHSSNAKKLSHSLKCD
mmetsp:Transcript_59997/g.152136  ORF Transcript_59997/g.152136 Transcript_59997/m.152136 type:complete len:244 (+) Transcript_59997:848-1579(+)